MSPPRRIVAGATYLLTRRVTRRHYLLRPDDDGTTQQIYWYVTGVIGAKFGMELHAVQMLSTHLHEVVTDVRGELPAFKRDRNRLFANAVKDHRGWPEEVFQRAQGSCVELHGAEAVLKEIGYTLANVVEAGLVDDPEDWPGVTVSVNDIGERFLEVERPSVYFDPKNPNWPERVRIPLTMPKVLIDAYGSRAKEVLVASVREAIEHARKLAREAGRVVSKSAKELCKVPFTRRSKSFSLFGSRSPTFATGGNAEMAKKARAERKQFLDLYRRALDALKRGVKGISFPMGTWRWARELLPSWLLDAKDVSDRARHSSSDGLTSAAWEVAQDAQPAAASYPI